MDQPTKYKECFFVPYFSGSNKYTRNSQLIDKLGLSYSLLKKKNYISDVPAYEIGSKVR